MIPFYYKGILISEQVQQHAYYADAIEHINDWIFNIRNDYGVKLLGVQDYNVIISAPLAQNLVMVCELNNTTEWFGLYDKQQQTFITPSLTDIVNVSDNQRYQIERRAGRFCSAIARGELPLKHNSLVPAMQSLWEEYKHHILYQHDYDVITRTADAEFIQDLNNRPDTYIRFKDTMDQVREMRRNARFPHRDGIEIDD